MKHAKTLSGVPRATSLETFFLKNESVGRKLLPLCGHLRVKPAYCVARVTVEGDAGRTFSPYPVNLGIVME